MEISFEGKSLKYYRRVCETSLSNEETMEIIVPDTMPDAAAVIDTDGVVLLRGKEAMNGRFTVSGVTDVFVIYKPEDGSGPRKLSVQIPFDVTGECPNLTNMGRVTASCRLVSAESRIINSRKVLVKTEVCVTVSAYVQEQMDYAIPAIGSMNNNMQLLEKSRTLRTVADVTEKTFSIVEDNPMPSSKPPMGTMLKSRLRLTMEEAGSLGSKLIVKGNACVVIVYASASDGEIASVDFKMPYSVILELDWDDDDLIYDTSVMTTGFAVTENSGGGINVEIGAVVQAAIWRKSEINYITDAYSTDYETELGTKNASVDMLTDKTTQSDTMRIVVETSKQTRTIIDAIAYIGKVRAESGAVKAPVTAKVLCIAEDGSMFAASAKTEASKAGDMKDMKMTAELGELFTSPAASGVEIRVPVVYGISKYKTAEMNMTVSAVVKEDIPKNKADSPSIIVFRASGSDNLWEIGKRYGTTLEMIRKANGLAEDGEIGAGDLVLVAKQR